MARGELFRALQLRDFRTWWIGSLLSNSGTMVQFTTVPFVFHALTGSGTWVAAASVMNILPMVLLSPLGGSLSDRYPRQRILLVTQVLATAMSAVFGTMWAMGVRSPWAYLVASAVSGSISGINLPSWQSIIGDLVPQELMMNAVTLNSAQFNASRALGPAVGGVALAQFGPAWCFYINTGSYVFVLYALVRLQLRRREPVVRAGTAGARPTVREEIGDTVRAIRHNAPLRMAVTTVAVVAFLGYPIPSLIVFFQEDVYGAPRWMLGVLTAAIGVGAIAVAPTVAGRAKAVPASRLLPVPLLVYAAMTAVFGLSPGPAVGVVALVCMGGAHLAVTSTLFTVVQLGVDPAMRGKVMAGYLMVLNVATMLGSLGLGALIDLAGPRTTVTAAGAAFGLAAVALLTGGRLRGLDGAGPAVDRPVHPSGRG
jgi:MFS family permease